MCVQTRDAISSPSDLAGSGLARLVAVTRSRISHAVTARLTSLVRGGKYFGANSVKNAANLPLTGEILVQRLRETVRRIMGLKARRWSTNGRAGPAGLHKLAGRVTIKESNS